MKKLKVGIAGYGIVGKRRHHFINKHPNLEVKIVCDQIFKNSVQEENGIIYYKSVDQLLEQNIDILFVCLTNNVAAEVTIKGLKRNMHVFCEKPPGMNVNDIERVIKVEKNFPHLKLKYGFNHRYHDSIRKALSIVKSNELGSVINLRGVYGKSKVIPYTGGWRSQRKFAGGGILLDQGIHMVDLISLFCSDFVEIKSFISNNYWKHDVEDNAYALLKDSHGRIAMLNSSATQWQHKFYLELSLTNVFIELSGILSVSKSYGEEKIIYGKKDENGEVTEAITLKFLDDNSWEDEIFEFADAILNNQKIKSGSSNDAHKSMKTIFDIYQNDIEWSNKYEI